MKKIKFMIPLVAVILFLGTSCGNSGSDTTSTSDTTVKTDTISRNPENFSNPH